MKSDATSSKVDTQPNKSSSGWLKRFILAFFTVLGGITFFTAIFLAIHILVFVSPKEHKTPTADGKKLYADMKQAEEAKAYELAEANENSKRMRKFVRASRGRISAHHINR